MIKNIIGLFRRLVNNFFGTSSGCCKLSENENLGDTQQKNYFTTK